MPALADILDVAVSLSAKMHFDSYVVGGVVRDLILSGPSADYDLDILIDGDGHYFAKALAKELNWTVTLHDRFLTAKIALPDRGSQAEGLIDEVDVATARTEVYEQPGALPKVSRAKFEDDLRRRDFSVNAMALKLSDYQRFLSGVSKAEIEKILIDPFNGREDLSNKLIRILHSNSFMDDPTRLCRGVRYKARLSGEFEANTQQSVLEAVQAKALSLVSRHRLTNELFIGLEELRPDLIFQGFFDLGFFDFLKVVNRDASSESVAALRKLSQLRQVNGDGLPKQVRRMVGFCILLSSLGREDQRKVLEDSQQPKALKRMLFDMLSEDSASRGQAQRLLHYSLGKVEFGELSDLMLIRS